MKRISRNHSPKRSLVVLLLCFIISHLTLARSQDKSFTDRMIDLTIREISQKGPTSETAIFISRSLDLFWPKRNELLKATLPYLTSADTTQTAACLDILYRLRGYKPATGLSFSLEAWKNQNASFYSQIDSAIQENLKRLLQSKDSSLLQNLALYLGTSPSQASREALLELARHSVVSEQALICLTWHREATDMEVLLPFMLNGGPGATSLPYHFRNSYGKAAVPYLEKVLEQSNSNQVKLQTAFELVHIKNRAGYEYLVEAALNEGAENGSARIEEIKRFAIDYLGLRNFRISNEDLSKFLKKKMRE